MSKGLKTLQAGGLAPLHVYVLNFSAPGSLAQVVNQVLQVGFFTLGYDLYPPIR